MYTELAIELRGLLNGYTDALALACSSYEGYFTYGEFPILDHSKTNAENIQVFCEVARKILDEKMSLQLRRKNNYP